MIRAFRAAFLILSLALSTSAQHQGGMDSRFEGIAKEFGGRLGVAAKDLVSGETVLYNADTLFPTASVIKLPVLVELFHKFHDGELSPTKPVRLLDSLKKPGSGVLQYFQGNETLQLIDVATLMIILSDNTATNYVIDQFAQVHDDKLEAVNSRMRSLGLRNTKLLNRLYSFATKKKTEEARRFGIGVSSPADMMMLLEKMAKGEIISQQACDSMITIMKGQYYLEAAARWLPFTEDSTLWLANKTGSLDDRKIDVGLANSANGKYVYAIFADGSTDLGEQMDNKCTLAIAKVSRMLYDRFMKKGSR
jgi:beta-lactamase class A